MIGLGYFIFGINRNNGEVQNVVQHESVGRSQVASSDGKLVFIRQFGKGISVESLPDLKEVDFVTSTAEDFGDPTMLAAKSGTYFLDKEGLIEYSGIKDSSRYVFDRLTTLLSIATSSTPDLVELTGTTQGGVFQITFNTVSKKFEVVPQAE